MRNSLVALLMLLGLAAPAAAQIVRADRITLNTGPCVERSGSGTPEGVQSGNPCDSWRDTVTGLVYEKVSGTATTSGWHRLVGATGATCTTFAGCVAATLSLDTLAFTQTLRTDSSKKLQQTVTSDGAQLRSFNGGGWAPLQLYGGPTQIAGGGVHVGQTVTADPGVGNLDVDGYVGVPGYASQTTGWRVTAAGSGDFQYIYAGELHAKSFVADLEQALAGGQIISKSVAVVGATFTVPAAGSVSTLTVKDLPSAAGMAVFEAGDFVRLRTFSRAAGELDISDAWGTVTGYADAADGLQTWTFTRAVANGGAMAAGTEVAVESLVLDYGVSGNGFYEVNAIDGLYGVNSPYAQIVTWAGNSPYSGNQTVRARFGNLLGITSVAEYGLLAGTYAATGGQYFKASDIGFELHGIDMALWNGATKVLAVDHLTPYWSMGSPAPTSFSSGTGCWQGMDAGVFKWRCGDISGGTQYIAWNGTQLTVSGAIVIVGTAIDASSVNGVAGATVVSGAARGLLGIDSSGNPLLPATATPSGSGLFLGSDFMGYYASGAWKTYMDNTGGFYLGGVSGSLQWNGTTLTVTGTLAGNGSAVTSISGGNITTGSVTATQIAAGSITAAKIAAGTITATELAADSVTSAKILAGTIVASDIASGTITATQVSAGVFISTGGAGADVNTGATTINGPMITTGTITTNQIAAGTITASNIAAGTITATEIAAATISGAKIAATTITAANIAAGTITATEIAADAITSAKILAGTIVASDIATGTITANEIAAGTITAAKMGVTDLSAITANLGTITAGSLTLGSSGYVRQGQTAYNTGTGFWLGDVSGTPKFSIGNPSGNSMTWDGTTLTVNAVHVDSVTTLATTGGAYGSFSAIGGSTFIFTGSGNGDNVTFTAGLTGGVNGQLITISNRKTAGTVTITYGAAGSFPNNFTTPAGTDIVLGLRGTITAQYQSSPATWYVLTVTP